ncbi:MAG: hypothetical protein WD336_01295 [Trueperaceae bacterium]
MSVHGRTLDRRGLAERSGDPRAAGGVRAVTLDDGAGRGVRMLDPTWGDEAAAARADGCGLLFAYEKSGYDTRTDGRKTELLPGTSVRRLVEGGATGIKLLVYYAPDHDPAVNDVTHALVERVGAECTQVGVPLFLEPVTYDDADDPVGTARRWPDRVRGILEELSNDRYGVDVLQVEYPVDPKFSSGLAGGSNAVPTWTPPVTHSSQPTRRPVGRTSS